MPRVDWITWKTEANDIINPGEILDEITKKIGDYNTYINSTVYEGLNSEIEKGGLAGDSFVLNGNSLAHEKASTIMNNLEEINTLIENLKNKVQTSIEEQKEIEKQQLIENIQIKIEEEEKIKNNTMSLNEKLQTENPIINKDTVENIIETTDQRISHLKEKLEIIKTI